MHAPRPDQTAEKPCHSKKHQNAIKCRLKCAKSHSNDTKLPLPESLEHFTFYCRLDVQSLNHALALSGGMGWRASVMAWSRVSVERALMARRICLILDQAFSMGFRSGE